MVRFKVSEIRANNIIGKSLRLPLLLLPKTSVLPIMQGVGKGLKWIVGSGVHGMWLGSYEADQQQLLTKLSLEGTTVLDIGANVGFFSILLSRIVGRTGKILAFEPLPRNIDFIQQHINLNKIGNITVYPLAISDKSGNVKFHISTHHAEGYIAENGELEVSTITLDSLDIFLTPVSLVKIDVEGAEADVLRGGKMFFQSHRPIILLATHGNAQANDCQKILTEYSYSMQKISSDLYGADCNEWLVKPNEHSNES